MGKESARYLDNLLRCELETFGRVFRDFQKGKEGVLFRVFKILAGRELIEPTFGYLQEGRSIEPEEFRDFPSGQAIGLYISQLRARETADNRIYEQIRTSRDSFLESRGWSGLSYLALLQKRQIGQIYGSVVEGLKEMRKLSQTG